MRNFVGITLCAVLVGWASTTLAEEAASEHAAMGNFGVHGGVNFAQVSTDPDSSTGTNTGLVVGIHTDIHFLPFLTLEPNIQFAQRGYSTKVLGIEQQFRANYIEMPILLKMSLPIPLIVPTLLAGPNFGVKVGDGCSSDFGGCVSPNWESTHFGFDVGLGFDIPIVVSTAWIQARYHLGMTDVTPGAGDVNHRGVMLLAGFAF